MDALSTSGSRVARRRIPRDAARTLAAAMLAYFLSVLLSLPEPYWASLAAVIATRAYAGAARHIGTGRTLGALAGAVWAAGVAVLAGGRIPDSLALALTVALPALLAAWNPLYRPALVAALIVLTAGGHAAWGVALLRVAALGAGTVTAVVVSALFWPRSARDEAKALAGQIGRTLAAALDAARRDETACIPAEDLHAKLESLRKLAFAAGKEKHGQDRTDALYAATAKAVCSVSTALRLMRARREADGAGPGAAGLPGLVRRDLRDLKRAVREDPV